MNGVAPSSSPKVADLYFKKVHIDFRSGWTPHGKRQPERKSTRVMVIVRKKS